MLDFQHCDAARLRRDPAYDGVFFIAVRSTRIYCRTVCKVKQPLTRNIQFFASAAAAEHAGFRPCLRCRPETAPFCPAWRDTRDTFSRALALIEQGALDHGTIDALCAGLGIDPTQLSGLCNEHLGTSPVQIARTLRTQRAKRLINTTRLTMADIAQQAGFGSVRAFNAAIAALYRRTPQALRRTGSFD